MQASGILENILQQLKATRNIDLFSYRKSTLRRRLRARMARLGISRPHEYLALFKEDAEKDQLLNALTVQVSSFFRDPMLWELLAAQVIPSLIKAKLGSASREIRVWVAGCSSGEEAYSLAITLKEAMGKLEDGFSFHIFATDINQKALNAARLAIYPRGNMQNVKLGILDRYFQPTANDFKLSDQIRAMVHFSWDDVTSDQKMAPVESVFGGFDLVMCRNVLIYFSKELQEKVLTKLLRSLSMGGWLVLGASETIDLGLFPGLACRDQKHRIYQIKPQEGK
jgi:chemotaxis protein methyltransferase CheR